MHQGQEQFLNYILERVQDGKDEQAEALLEESFKRQADDTFTKEYMDAFQEDITKILKPEAKDEVIAVMNQFGSSHISK